MLFYKRIRKNLFYVKGGKLIMALCDVCWGSGVVDKGTPEERECPFCCGTGFVEDKDEDE